MLPTHPDLSWTRWGAPLLLAAALSSCASGPLPGPENQFGYFSNDYQMPVSSIQQRRFVGVVRQQYDFSCGSAALATLLRYHYDDPQNEQSVFLGMWQEGDREQIRKLGFSLLDMKRYLAGRGIAADGYRVTLKQVSEARIPGIALLDTNGYKHFVVVKGVGDGRLLVGDPALGMRLLSQKQFLAEWNGILFVINARNDLGRSGFGRPAEWGLVPTWQHTQSLEPLSLQMLALTRPLPGEL